MTGTRSSNNTPVMSAKEKDHFTQLDILNWSISERRTVTVMNHGDKKLIGNKKWSRNTKVEWKR